MNATRVSFASKPIQLVPIHPCTREALPDRPTLTLQSATSILFLGDNDSTGIVDPAISHKCVKIYVKSDRIFAFVLPDGRGNVKHNGLPLARGCRRELRLGDLVSLEGSDEDEEGDYRYRVEQSGHEYAAVPTAVAAMLVPTQGATIDSSLKTTACIQREVGEEIICAVCMEIMVEPQTIVPCGHSFCRACLVASQPGQCAECRGPIQSYVICRSLQNLVERLVDASEKQSVPIFEREDIESYRKRCGSEKNPAFAISRKRRCIEPVVSAAGIFGGGAVWDLTD